MKEQLINELHKLGLNYQNNLYLDRAIDIISNNKNDFIVKLEKFRLSQLVVELNNIKKFDLDSFEEFKKSINGSKNDINFWGQRFEISFYSGLISFSKHYDIRIRRGRSGIEADFIVDFSNKEIGIELSTLKLMNIPSNIESITRKIKKSILNKNAKDYATENCLLIIDLSQLIAQQELNKYSIKAHFKENISTILNVKEDILIDYIVFVHNYFCESIDQSLKYYFKTDFGIANPNKPPNVVILELSRILFNNYNLKDDCVRTVRYLN